MEFHSARFAGDQTLQGILDDPDTGTAKLGKDSPVDAVRLVQRALADLGWTHRVDPPVDRDGFDDGDFGPDTRRVVLAYKRHYGIHYPPDAPTGLIDHYVGPRTVRKLDVQIAFFDVADVEIDAKIAALTAAGHVTTADPAGEGRSFIWIGHPVVMRYVLVDGERGAIMSTFDVGTFEVHGPLFAAYRQHPDIHGSPISDTESADGLLISRFEHSVLKHDVATGTTYVEGSAMDPGY